MYPCVCIRESYRWCFKTSMWLWSGIVAVTNLLCNPLTHNSWHISKLEILCCILRLLFFCIFSHAHSQLRLPSQTDNLLRNLLLILYVASISSKYFESCKNVVARVCSRYCTHSLDAFKINSTKIMFYKLHKTLWITYVRASCMDISSNSSPTVASSSGFQSDLGWATSLK